MEFERNKVMLYHWLGWISLAMCILLLIKYIGRVSRNKTINYALRKIHKPLGIAVIAVGAIHGVISIIKSPQEIAANISGLLVWLLIAFLAATFYARKSLKSKWFKLHRMAAVLLIVGLVAHIAIAVAL